MLIHCGFGPWYHKGPRQKKKEDLKTPAKLRRLHLHGPILPSLDKYSLLTMGPEFF